jgi:hypothetical protein
LLRRRGYFIPFVDVHLQSGEQVFETVVLNVLHRERVNKVFGKRSSRLLARFVKFFTTAHLPFRQSRAEGHRLQRKLCHADHRLHPVVIIKEP